MEYQVKAVRGKEMALLNIVAQHAEEAKAQARAKGYTPIAVSSNAAI